MGPRRYDGWFRLNFVLYGALALMLAVAAGRQAYLGAQHRGNDAKTASSRLPRTAKIDAGPVRTIMESPVAPVAERLETPVALPSRNPRRAGTPGRAGPARGEPAVTADPVAPAGAKPGNPDTWSPQEIKAAVEHCRARLGAIAAEARVMAPIKKGRCGTAAPIRLSAIGTNPLVRIVPPAIVNCDMAAALHAWVTTKLQPAANEALGVSIARIQTMSSYACRNRYSRANGKLSEHARANAIDIGSFRTVKGRLIDIETLWGPTEADIEAFKRRTAAAAAAAAVAAGGPATTKAGQPGGTSADGTSADGTGVAKPGDGNGAQAIKTSAQAPAQVPPAQGAPAKAVPAGPPKIIKPGRLRAKDDAKALPEARFLHKIHAQACGIFGTVLGPEANEAHRNHFHFDLIRRRRRAFCE